VVSLWGADRWEDAYADAGPATRRGPFHNQDGVGLSLHTAMAGEDGGGEEDCISAHGVSALMYFILDKVRQPDGGEGQQSSWRKQVEDLVGKVALALDPGGVGTRKRRTALVDSESKNESEWDDVSEMVRRATGADKLRDGFPPAKWFDAEMSTPASRLVLPLTVDDGGKLTLVIAVSYDARMLAFKTPRPNTAGFIFFPTSPNCNRAQNCRCFGMYDGGEDAALIAEHWKVRHL